MNSISKSHNISYYCVDMINKCVDKFISPRRHHPPLVHYCATTHMYWVGDKDKALSLIRGGREIEFKINSDMIQQHSDSTNVV